MSSRLQQILTELGLKPLTFAESQTFDSYLALLLRWNAKTNLTSIRDEELILRRHFAESVQCARLLPKGITSLLDYGSGAGFPGLPCAICRPEIAVTLSESQSKKSAFLREAVRHLGLTTNVHAGRVEALHPALLFDAVTLRAVDQMHAAVPAAVRRVKVGGWLALLCTENSAGALQEAAGQIAWNTPIPLLGTRQEILLLGQRSGMFHVEHPEPGSILDPESAP